MHRHPEVLDPQVASHRKVLQQREQWLALVPGRGRRDDALSRECRQRDDGDVARQADLLDEVTGVAGYLVEALLGPADGIHLVEREHDVRHAEQRHESRMPARLRRDAVTHVDENHRRVRRRRARHHVAGVLDVARGVSQDEGALRGREVAVRHVDRDALLPLRTQTVGQQCEVDGVGSARRARRDHGVERVGQDVLRVVQQAPDEGGLAVVDAARDDEAQLFRSRRSTAGVSRP